MAINLSTIASSIGDSTDMSRSEQVNKWSKRKFVRHSSRSKLTDAQMKEVNYGFNIPVFTLSNLVDGTTQTQRTWTYLQPRSGTDPSRMGDMEGYDHYARKKTVYFIKDGATYAIYLNSFSSLRLDELNDGGDTNAVKIADLKASGVTTSYQGGLVGLEVVIAFMDVNSNGKDYVTHVLRTGTKVAENYVTSKIEVTSVAGLTAGKQKRLVAFACTDPSPLTLGVMHDATTLTSGAGWLIPLNMTEANLDISEPVYTIYQTTPLPATSVYITFATYSIGDGRAENVTITCKSYSAASVQMKFELAVRSAQTGKDTVIGSNTENAVRTWERYNNSMYAITYDSIRLLPSDNTDISDYYNPASGDKLILRAYIKQSGSGTTYGAYTEGAFTEIND